MLPNFPPVCNISKTQRLLVPSTGFLGWNARHEVFRGWTSKENLPTTVQKTSPASGVHSWLLSDIVLLRKCLTALHSGFAC